MRPRPLPMRLTAFATASALALATAPAAWAAPPPIPPRVDPPSRVGRLARIDGSVSFHSADADRWSPAMLNRPLTTGDVLWTEPGARADLQLAANRLVLAPSTELEITALGDQALAASEPQGETFLDLRMVPQGDTYAIQTPRGVVQIMAAGRYDVVAGDADHPTLVTVIDGAAQVTGPGLALPVGPRQTATLTGTTPAQGSVGPMAQDAFLTAVLAEERPAPRPAVAIPPVVEDMTGAEDLDQAGRWQETPQYGTVWYPPVEANWVPYRDGHWAYVAPWGWTWVDDAPWGFAPFHYGRWVQVDNHWGWIPVTPGAVYRSPVYAPALVSFLAVGAAGLAAGALAGRSVGWVPLGPREPYYPPYRANLAYVRNLNATNVQNVDQASATVNVVNSRPLVNNFVNRAAATVVPATAMVASSPIAALSHPLPPEQFAATRAQFNSPVPPGAATAGVTPAVARQFNFVPPGRPAQPVPGPAIRGRPVAEAGRPAATGAAPMGAPGRAKEAPAAAPRPAATPAVPNVPPRRPAPPAVSHAPPTLRPLPPARPAPHAAPPPRPAPPPRAAPAPRPAPPPRPAAPPPRPHPEERRP